MDLQVKPLAAKCYNRSLSPGTHMVEEKNQLLQDVLWLPHIHCSVWTSEYTWSHTTKINIKSQNILIIFQVCAFHFHKQCKHFDVQSSCLIYFWILPSWQWHLSAGVWCVCYFVVSIGIPVAYYGKCLFVHLLIIRWDLWSMLIWFDCFCIAKFWKLFCIF